MTERDAVVCDGHQELRDIVIETRADVKHILDTLGTIQKCINEHEGRIRTIEIVGSNKATVALQAVETMEVSLKKLLERVVQLEKNCGTDEAVEQAKASWLDNLYVRVSIVVGAACGIIGLLWMILQDLRGMV